MINHSFEDYLLLSNCVISTANYLTVFNVKSFIRFSTSFCFELFNKIPVLVIDVCYTSFQKGHAKRVKLVTNTEFPLNSI